MKLLLNVLIASGLSGCALIGVYGPEAQERAQQGLEQIGQGVAQAGAAYAQGYAQTYNACPALPPPLYHSGVITQMGQQPAFYSGDQNGGTIIQMGQPPVFISGY